MNGKRIYIFLGILVILGGSVKGYTEFIIAPVKIKAENNEKRLAEFKEETNQNIKEIKYDQKETLIKITRALTILEDLKKNN